MMFQRLFLLQFFLLLSSTTATAKLLHTIPRLSPTGPRVWRDHPDQISGEFVGEDFETFFYNQTLDHFNYRPESYDTFSQRYLINFKYWGGANVSAPVLVYLGAEEPIDGDLAAVGFLADNAVQFSSLLVFIEHRYYGKSIPFGSREEALRDASKLGYFNSAQAIADYAAIIIHIKEKLKAKYSPVIVIGGSYGGMLASWFRLKYPHIALGALASSAPILYFDDITPPDAYYSIVSRVFREASGTCYQTIKNSWAEIDELASKSNGLSMLSEKFKTCNPLTDASKLKDQLNTMYASAAQYNKPPTYPVNKVCAGIDGGGFGDDILSRIFGGLVAYNGNLSCYVNAHTAESETTVGWRWQTCSELAIPIGIGNNSMFPPDPFDLEDYIEHCKSLYGVPTRPHWVTTYYGGHSIKLILQRFASNIIFSNGLRDPYSSGGVLENISDTIVAVSTVNGSHCLDILFAKETDPEWLVAQRKIEIKIMKEWIDKYYADLSMF
ncbi:PROTEASE S28 PRO-X CARBOXYPEPTIDASE-RELATED [Salix purpurea]|uniref:PROTEASE S28 PRO-X CARBOXYPEPTIDASE-RELATED n=1 Tax=Salix purpurea TaxID=77065 RepID=A0A9Q0WEC7_SALPP|nr:PROTEASE S28 PRO-X CARBOXYPEPTIDASE-RELATED [Salix purpurea]